ncbi:MAG: VOC family protein [Candidatus Nanopelagicales bacterium]
MSGKVVHFEIPIDDSARATEFYSATFGWEFQQWGPMEYWGTAAGTGEGIGGALTKREDAAQGLTFYIAVENIDETLAAIESTGGTRLSERMPIPGTGWMALFRDTEGNRVGLFQEDPTVPLPS